MSLELVYNGLGFQDLLSELEALGFFQYVLPFLLIFAVVYAILTQIDTFSGNKGASLLIALSIGLLSLQLNFVPIFFQKIFPKFGIGISILLIALILMGAFVPQEKEKLKWVFFGIGAVIFLFVVLSSFSRWEFTAHGWWDRYGAMLITAAVIIASIVGVVWAQEREEGKP